MIRQRLFGWFDQKTGTFRISRYPPDAPVRPSAEFATKAQVTEAMRRKRADVYWWPPLAREHADAN